MSEDGGLGERWSRILVAKRRKLMVANWESAWRVRLGAQWHTKRTLDNVHI